MKQVKYYCYYICNNNIMKFLFLLLWSFFANRKFFSNIIYNSLNNYLERDINDYSNYLNQSRNTYTRNYQTINEGYDETYTRNETKEIEDMAKIRSIFIKFHVLKILQNENISNIYKLEILNKYISENIDHDDDSELNHYGNNFFRDITSHEFFKYLDFNII